MSTLQLLEAIGAISKEDGKKAASRGSNYQDSVTIPLDRAHDDDAVGLMDGEDLEQLSLTPTTSNNILHAVDKV